MPKVVISGYGTYAFLPFQPEAPVVETLEYSTDNLVSRDGTEQAIRLRVMARREFDFNYPINAIDDQHTFNMVYGAIRKKWLVPMWTEGQVVSCASAVTVVNADTITHDLRAASLALLWESAYRWEIVRISTITTTQITLVAATTTGAYTNAFLLPLRQGWIKGQISRPTFGQSMIFNITFELDDLIIITPSAPAQYLSNDIYTVPFLRTDDGAVTTGFRRQEEAVDFNLGIIVHRDPWVLTKYESMYRAITINSVEQKAFTDWFHRRIGKYKRFWMPSFENNYRMKSTGTIVSTVQFYRDSVDDYTPRLNVAFEGSDGTWYPRVLSSPTYPDAVTVQFTLSAPLNLPASNVYRTSYLGLYRLNTDQVEMSWIGNGVMDASMPILELQP